MPSLPRLAAPVELPRSWEFLAKIEDVHVIDCIKRDGTKFFVLQATFKYAVSDRFNAMGVTDSVLRVERTFKDVVEVKELLDKCTSVTARPNPMRIYSKDKHIITCTRCNAMDDAVRSVGLHKPLLSSKRKLEMVAKFMREIAAAAKRLVPMQRGSHVCNGCPWMPFVVAQFFLPSLPSEEQVWATYRLQFDVMRKRGPEADCCVVQ